MVEDENKTSGMEKKVGDNESESGSSKDSVSSQGDLVVTADQKRLTNKHGDGNVGKSMLVSGSKTDSIKSKPSDEQKFVKTVPKSNRRPSTPSAKRYSGKDVDKKNGVSKTPFKSSGVDESPFNNVKEISKMDQISSGTRSIDSDEEATDTVAAVEFEGNKNIDLLIQEMESKIGKLEEELREVAALEISIYSVVPEHGSSAHKVHTPARRLSRLCIHACKHWNQETRATVAKNTVSGLVLVSKSCGNDITRLTFWLSNIVVLREIICETFGASCHSIPATKYSEINTNSKKNVSYGNLNNPVLSSLQTEWQETGTFTSALKGVESWIFFRLVESVWWQALAPNMQSGTKDHNKYNARVPGPSLGDQQQGNFSINLWQNAFEQAFQKLCPVRAGGHECGCLPVLAKMVMEQCVARLDVAMFNAILRESVHEIPTDPISDPIVDPKVLPIPAGELSFGSGAQLKNSIGTWSRWLTGLSNADVRENSGSQQQDSDDDSRSDYTDSVAFPLLNSLSDLLMLPKDMLMDRSLRKEVCPLINLSLIKRILCNFTPDEFCLDPIPGSVLESLNSESIVERRLSGDSLSSFPYKAGAVVYSPPKTSAAAYKVAEIGTRTQLMRNASLVQKKGYTSDDELQELSSPLESIFDKLHISPSDVQKSEYHGGSCSATNTRYELLSEVWRI